MGKTFSTGLLTNGLWQDASNNIGIGGSPSGSYKLEVTGTAKVSSTLLVSGASTLSSTLQVGGTTSSTITIGDAVGSATDSNIRLRTGSTKYAWLIASQNNVAGFEITPSTAVGGTTFSTPALTILPTGAATFSSSVTVTTPSGSSEGLKLICADTIGDGYISYFRSSAVRKAYFGYAGSNDDNFTLMQEENASLIFGTNGSERMRITSAGQIYNSNAPSADWGMRIFGSSVSGSSYGMEILAGTTSGDISFAVSPRNGSVYYFRVLGNGDIKSVPVYNNSTSNAANMYIFSDGSFSRSTSSLRFKTDVETLDNNISETIYKMRPIWYRSLCEKDRRDWSWYGFGAEELAKLEPRLVHWGYKKEDYVINEETKEQELKEGAELQADGVQYERITVLLVAEMQKMNNAIQELSAQNQDLKSRLDKAGL